MTATPGLLSPVLLLGAGTGEATCGILYLAGFLRRHGVEAYVRLFDGDGTDRQMVRSLEGLLTCVRPRLAGISLKWFHHLARARRMARALREIDPGLRIVLGGDTASYFWRSLIQWDCADHVVLGDGELPLLALCRGDASPPNVVSRATGAPRRAPLAYVQDASSGGAVFYSHFDDIFLSQMDLCSFSGWIAPGKGCGENCLYCGGGRSAQEVSFGRARPFLRPVASVRADHREIVPRTWQLRYDFSGGTARSLRRYWAGSDLTRHSTTYFLWGPPPPGLAGALAGAFQRVFMVLDIGCFSERQRLETMRRGLLKRCPPDRELLEIAAACLRHRNLELEVSGIAGLPFASEATLEEERGLVERLLGLGCQVGYQRLEVQPGAQVTEHPERFDMVAEARTFAELLDFFTRNDPAQGAVPMVRFRDRALEAAVQRASERVEAMVRRHAESTARGPAASGRTRLRNASASTRQYELGAWLGRHRVPDRLAREKVTVVRSNDGAGLACAPSLGPRQLADPSLYQGEAASQLLDVLATFEHPVTVDAALARLRANARGGMPPARALIDRLLAGRFLQPE